MRFKVLGLVSIASHSETVVLHSSKPMSLLTALLLRPNEVLSIDFLQVAVWDQRPPPTAKATLQTYVLRLRRLFQKYGISDNSIETIPGGYRFYATADTLDLLEFEELVRMAILEGDPQIELKVLREALALWQGRPLANIESSALHRDEVPRLVEGWLRATERRFDLELSLGMHRDVAAELRTVTRSHPGYERFWEQLIESLYRSGRQSDALAEYRNVKTYLKEELGVDPGPTLQRLELAILRGEQLPALADVDARIEVSGHQQGLPTDGSWHPLPPDLPHFVGRRRETDLLAARITAERAGPMVVVISGIPGAGKSAVAVHVAHEVKAHFPDGQWGIDMAEPDRKPCTAAADQRILLIIDNASSIGQVEALLPTSPGSAAIVTSRTSLAGLAAMRGGWMLRLGALQPEESYQLLSTILGPERVEAESHAARDLADLCGHLPSALRVAASRLLLGHRSDISEYVDWLHVDTIRKLSLSADRTMSIFDLFSEFLAELTPTVADAFLKIAGSSLANVTIPDCAEILGLQSMQTESVVESLVDASLLEVGPAGGYHVQPILRTVARAVLVELS
jgi:DNA-binding SARP family transcriptional activator